MININWFVNELKIYQELSLRKEVSDYRLFNKATCMNNKYFTNHIRCFMRI